MVPTENGIHNEEFQQERSQRSTGKKLIDYIPISISTIERELGDHHSSHHEERFLDFLRAHPSHSSMQSDEVPEIDPPAPTQPDPARPRRHVAFVRKMKWSSLKRYFKKWIKHPANAAYFIWFMFVVVGLLMFVLLSLGVLNGLVTGSTRRKDWTEVVNQILNALFLIMCLYQHPYLIHHTVLICRWSQKDRVYIRKLYCKDGGVRPYERAHVTFVLLLLHATCISQYVTAVLFWAYDRHTRPNWAVITCLAIGTGTPVIALIHTMRSPMGKRYENVPEMVQESQMRVVTIPEAVIVTEPEWIGGLFDCGDDLTVASCSLLCTFCVFGWNMERLGFGNMYVHMLVFILLCVAPILIFGATALNIENDSIADIVAISGAVVSVLGLLYGGFWRTELRKKFKLPGNPFCCGYPSFTDYMQWLFCWPCALAQEVRTANFYDIEEDSFHSKASNSGRFELLPLSRESESGPLNGYDSSARSYSSPAQFKLSHLGSSEAAKGFSPANFSVNFQRSFTDSRVHDMTPPPLIHLEK